MLPSCNFFLFFSLFVNSSLFDAWPKSNEAYSSRVFIALEFLNIHKVTQPLPLSNFKRVPKSLEGPPKELSLHLLDCSLWLEIPNFFHCVVCEFCLLAYHTACCFWYKNCFTYQNFSWRTLLDKHWQNVKLWMLFKNNIYFNI